MENDHVEGHARHSTLGYTAYTVNYCNNEHFFSSVIVTQPIDYMSLEQWKRYLKENEKETILSRTKPKLKELPNYNIRKIYC